MQLICCLSEHSAISYIKLNQKQSTRGQNRIPVYCVKIQVYCVPRGLVKKDYIKKIVAC